MNKIINEISKKHEMFNECLNLEYRISSLKKLKSTILKNEHLIFEALKNDLNKSPKETFLTEINETIEEIDNQIKHLKKWSKPKKVKSTYQVYGTKSYIINKPKGKILLIVPFNYPFNLCFLPLVGAVAAGNKILIKMSSSTKNTNQIINKIIVETFDENHVYFLNQKLKKYDELFDYKPNMVFFTGSTSVGKQIELQCVNKNIEYVTEMGGQCPCIVYDEFSRSIYDRIIWAKFLNAGQTCVSINYLLYNENILNFNQKLIESIKKLYPDPINQKQIPKLINHNAYQRIKNIIIENKNNIIYGGKFNDDLLIIEPTLIKINNYEKLKKYGEIFGPILFIIELNDNYNEYIKIINELDSSPLAAYIYSSNKKLCYKFFNDINAGGYCFNDSISHLTNHHLPFGGVYSSGNGKYHGIYSFYSFSFTKSILTNFKNKNIPIKFPNNNIDLIKTKKLIKLIKLFKKG